MSWISKSMRRREESAPKPESSQEGHESQDSATDGIVIASDNPIRRTEDDTLGRAVVAQSFARQVLTLDATEGIVVGILGAWGSGKTSFINLARHEFGRRGVVILDFNPWMFSGAEQLVESFFVELSAQLRIRPGLAEIGKDLEDYGETFAGMTWLPLVGPWIERGLGAARVLSKILQRRKEGVGGRRAKLERALAALDKPILVVVDDIDRLSSPEIRDIFKLVRLTASFPNVVYLVAFDRVRVEAALGEQGVPGRAYLEKILQLAEDLPALPEDLLNRQIFSALDAALADVGKPGLLDDQVWPDVFMEVIRPLIRNIRDVRRYTAAARGTVLALAGQIALADVLALEAVRVFLPNVFAYLHGAVEGLTATDGRDHGRADESPLLAGQVSHLIEVGEPHGKVVRAMIERLFPAGQRHIGGSHYGRDWEEKWLIERRVAHEDILRLYLERVAGKRLQAFTDAESAWSYMADSEALDLCLRSIDPERLEDVIGSLVAYEDQFLPAHVVPGTIVLLNILPDLPERPRGVYDFGPKVVVGRVTYRLLRSLADPASVEAAVRAVLPRLNSLSAKFELLNMVGYREHVGHELVSEQAAQALEKEWRSEVLSSSPRDLDVKKEYDLLRVLLFTKREAHSSEGSLNLGDGLELTLALLQAARTNVVSQPFGSRAIRRSPRLAWEILVEVFGNEESLKQRIDDLKAIQPEGAEEVLALADRYLGGWRPQPFDDED